jgi:hypothetical protein
MPDSNDVDNLPPIVDRINDPVVADANPPEVVGAFDLSASVWARIRAQLFDPGQNPINDRIG